VSSGKLAWGVLAGLTAAYPFLVFYSLGRFDPFWLLGMLAGVAFLRAVWRGKGAADWLPVAAAAALLIWGRGGAVLWYPVMVNAFFLFWFAASLIFPPSAVERLARLMDPALPAEGVRYTRKVTWVWCGFFLFNGSFAAYTAVAGDMGLWAWYNGLVSYLLMAALMGGEYFVRRRFMRINGHA